MISPILGLRDLLVVEENLHSHSCSPHLLTTLLLIPVRVRRRGRGRGRRGRREGGGVRGGGGEEGKEGDEGEEREGGGHMVAKVKCLYTHPHHNTIGLWDTHTTPHTSTGSPGDLRLMR